MPNMLRTCGHRISYGEIPCRNQWLLISEDFYDQFSGEVDAEIIYRAMLPILRCPNCERLWIFWEGFAKPVSAYKPDSMEK
jgi:hypothetical protein